MCATTRYCFRRNCEIKNFRSGSSVVTLSHMCFSCVILQTLEQPTAVYFNIAGIGRSRVTRILVQTSTGPGNNNALFL